MSGETSNTATLSTQIRDGVGIITLRRPHRHNALDDATRDALAAAFIWAREEPAVHAVLLAGEGRSFCSGRDRSGFLDPAAHGSHLAMITTAQNIRRLQTSLGKPSICAMQGHVIGAGAELALGCDMRMAAMDLRFSLPEVGFGVVADTGSSHLLRRAVGPARAKWLLLSGEPLEAGDALSWGLAEWLTSPEALFEDAFSRAARLASRPREASRSQLALLEPGGGSELDQALGQELLVQLNLFEGEEYLRLSQAG